MDVSKFEPTAPGRLAPISGADFEHYAYVPDPLPDVIPLSSIRDEIRHHVRSEGGKGKIVELVEMLPESPVVSASLVARKLDASAVTANRLIVKLEELGYLKKITEGDYDKRYICEQIASAIE